MANYQERRDERSRMDSRPRYNGGERGESNRDYNPERNSDREWREGSTFRGEENYDLDFGEDTAVADYEGYNGSVTPSNYQGSYPSHRRSFRDDQHRRGEERGEVGRGARSFSQSEGNRRRSSFGEPYQGMSEKDFYGRGPKGYSRTDEKIRDEVCDCLMRDRDLNADEITVNVKDGIVTLSGYVEGREMKRRAEDLCEEVLGVKDVHNQLSRSSSSQSETKASQGSQEEKKNRENKH